MAGLSGGCLCSSVRYETPPGLMTLICHCAHCQKQSGSAFSINVIVPAEGTRVEGELKEFEDRGDTGARVGRLFCPSCGSPVLTKVETHPELLIVKAGTLDDPGAAVPAAEIFCERSFSWLTPVAKKRFPAGATSAQLFE